MEERTRCPGEPEPTDPTSTVVLDTVLALRQVVRERGTLPFDFGGVRAMDGLPVHRIGGRGGRCTGSDERF